MTLVPAEGSVPPRTYRPQRSEGKEDAPAPSAPLVAYVCERESVEGEAEGGDVIVVEVPRDDPVLVAMQRGQLARLLLAPPA